jgi:hypothetical protein
MCGSGKTLWQEPPLRDETMVAEQITHGETAPHFPAAVSNTFTDLSTNE